MDLTIASLSPILIAVAALLICLTVHEFSHALAAYVQGDTTARDAGRLTLNPIPHIDPIGTLLLPLLLMAIPGNPILFAYAKPVPVNPYNLRNPKRDNGMVALAGPAVNFFVAIVLGQIVQYLPAGPFTNYLEIAVLANVMLAVFNIIPIPPLDGSKMLFALLPERLHNVEVFLETYGMWILLPLLLVFYQVLSPLLYFFFDLFTGRLW